MMTWVRELEIELLKSRIGALPDSEMVTIPAGLLRAAIDAVPSELREKLDQMWKDFHDLHEMDGSLRQAEADLKSIREKLSEVLEKEDA
jgi:hypothetical protein